MSMTIDDGEPGGGALAMTTMRAAFTLEELLSHRVWAQRLGRRLVGAGDADDLVQEGWLAGLTARPPDQGGLRPWLATVLSRAAGKRRRSARRREAREQEAGALGGPVPSPEALVSQMELQRLLADLVLALEPRVREVMLLRFYQGLSSGEIARELGTPEGTVRWRLKTGVDELRRRLDERNGGRRDEWMRAFAPLLALERAPAPG